MSINITVTKMNATIHWKQLRRSLFMCRRWTSSYLQSIQHDDENQLFLKAYPEVIETLTTSELCRNLPHFTKRYKEMIEYTILKENRFRPSVCLEAYKIMEKLENFSAEKLHLMVMFAWTIELSHSAMIVQDDTWDETIIRGNDICWHKKPNVGLISINDGILLYEAAFVVLKKYFSSLKQYVPFAEILHYIKLLTAMGQTMDWQCQKDGQPVYELFNINNFRTIARHKSASSIVEGPIIGVLTMTSNLAFLNGIRDLLIEFGIAFQYDNDILDLYEKNGKLKEIVGNDIREGKLTWMSIKVLECGDQRVVDNFKQNYGRHDPVCEAEIIKIYNEFNMYQQYCEGRQLMIEVVQDRVKKMPSSLGQMILSTMKNVLHTAQ